MDARGGRVLRGWMLASVIFGVVGACVFPPEPVHGPCVQDSDCSADGNPCMRGICNTTTGFCKGEPQDLAFGDNGCDDKNPCTDEICEAGACAHKPSLSPPSDGNECTSDECTNSQVTHTAVADGTACGLGGNLKCVNGKCDCTSALECGQSTECLKFECTNSECKSTSLMAGTLVDGKDAGDCLKNVCDGADAVVTVPDLTDVPVDPTSANCKKKACDEMLGVIDVDDPTDAPPDDGNECTVEGCNGGAPIPYDPVANGTACGKGPACGPAAGGGYQATPHDACMNGSCVTPPVVSCGYYKCDAANTACMNTCQSVAECITGTFCDAATNSCKPVAGSGNACATGGECGSNLCVDGVCCNTQCTGLCERCNDPNNKGFCVAIPNGMDPENECAGADACDGSGQCRSPLGAVCALDNECLSDVCEDTVCCNVVCGGACKRCDIGGNNGTCGNVAKDTEPTGCASPSACDGAGNCKTQGGKPCGGNSECISGFCQDGVCCNSSCNGACARCDVAGSVGTCKNVTTGEQVTGCNGNNACDGNNGCKLVNGQSCTAANQCATGFCVDEDPAAGVLGFCCDAACTETCKSCAAAKTIGGVNGACDFIKVKTDPDNECSANMCNGANGKGCCDGAGVCVSL